MCKLICVSNRHLCGDFSERIRAIAKHGIPVILREKDLNENEYYDLLREVGNENIIAHSFAAAAAKAGIKQIHLPLGLLKKTALNQFQCTGCSVHSVEQALQAYKHGADYITLGHIFATDCKKDIPPRGTGLIRDVISAVPIPVYAIGGISPNNALSAIESGAAGVCVMSGFMKCSNINKYISLYRGILNI